MIVAVGGIKGGTGKSTLATNLAVLCVQAGRQALLVDADSQETATAFYIQRVQRQAALIDMGHLAVTGHAVREAVQARQEQVADIIIDCGARDTVGQRAALSIADILLVPFAPRAADIWTLDAMEAMIADLYTVHSALRACSCLNLADPRGPDNAAACALLDTSPMLQRMDTQIGRRKVFGQALAQGLGVSEYRPRNSTAVTEMESLYREIWHE